MLELATELMTGEAGSVMDFSSVADTAGDFISGAETDDFSLWDLMGIGLSGKLLTEPRDAEIITIRYTDTRTKLGKSRKTTPTGTGIFSPN